MSYWGAQVIVNLFSAITFIGPDLSLWIRGDYVVSDATLNRFFAFHVIAIPLVLIGLVAAHIVALHEVGRSEEHTSELQSLMRISYAVFCLKKKKKNIKNTEHNKKQLAQ